MTDLRSYLAGRFDRKVSSALKVIEGFRAELSERPIHALEWGNRAFEAGAELAVYQPIAGMLKGDKDLDYVLAVARRELRNKIRQSHSTSETSNMMGRLVCNAWAELVDELELHIEAEKKVEQSR